MIWRLVRRLKVKSSLVYTFFIANWYPLIATRTARNLSGWQIVADSQETCQMRGVKCERRYFAVYPGQENVPVWISVEIRKKFVFARKPKAPLTKGLFIGDLFFLHFFFFLTIKQLQKIKFKVFIFFTIHSHR